MTRHSERPQRDNTDLDAFFAEADDIIENWHGGLDASTWAADGSHQPAEIEGDYYASDYPAGVPDDEAADYVAARRREPARVMSTAERRRTNPRNGGGLFVPDVVASGADDPRNFPPSYVPLVIRMWLTDVWFASWLGVLRPEQADNIRSGAPTVMQSLRELDMLIKYVTGRDHADLVSRTERLWGDAMFRIQTYGANARAVLFPSGNAYTVGEPLPWPVWPECLLPVPPDRNEEYVKQVYLHSWLMLHPQLPVPIPVVGAVEGLVRQIIETQFSGNQLVAGLYGSTFSYTRDEERMCTRFALRVPSRNADGDMVWLTADAAISDQVAYGAPTMRRYDLPYMRDDRTAMEEAARRAGIHPEWFGIAEASAEAGEVVPVRIGDWNTHVPASAGTHDPFPERYNALTHGMEVLRQAYEPMIEAVTDAAAALTEANEALETPPEPEGRRHGIEAQQTPYGPPDRRRPRR